MFRSVAYCLFALAIATGLSANVRAEGEIDQIVHMDRPSAGNGAPLTGRQKDALYGKHLLRPGTYSIRPLHSDLCIDAFNTRSTSIQGHLRQDVCHPNFSSQDLFILPHPWGGYTVRTTSQTSVIGSPVTGERMNNCATVARGVVFGPARIDYVQCDFAGFAGDWTQVGAHDQRFDFRKTGRDTYEIGIFNDLGVTADCWAIAGGSRDPTADVIRWDCNGNADQRFVVTWTAPFFASYETELLQSLNWHYAPDGHVRLSPANGVEMTGPSSSYFETIADNGDYCMKRCSELADCKAWTWSAAGYGGNEKPMCHWKAGKFSPVNRGSAALGKLFSGIVRP